MRFCNRFLTWLVMAMARKRMIDPDFWIDEEIAQLPFEGRLLYIGLWNFADDQGVIPYKPNQIRAQIFPYDSDVDVRALLDMLIDMGKLAAYEVKGASYLHIRNFMRHQSVKKPSIKYPAPPNGTELVRNQFPIGSEPVPPQYPTSTEPVRNQFPRKEKKGIEKKGREEDTTLGRREESDNKSETLEASAPSPSPTSLQQQNNAPLGYSPTNESREKAWEVIREIESILGAPPFTGSQVGDGRKDRMVEELSAVCRLLSPAEVVEIVKREHDRRVQESKGTDRPTNLAYYMPAIKQAFIERDRALEEAERKRDEEKRAAKRDAHEEPVPLGEILGKDLTEEEREKVLDRIKQVKERIRA